MSKCIECIYYDRCDHYHTATDTGPYAYQNIDLENRDDVEIICDDFDKKSNYIEKPCEIGQKCWFIKNLGDKSREKVIETAVEKIVLKKGGLYLKLECNAMYENSCKVIGTTIFFSEEELNNKLLQLRGIAVSEGVM